MKKKIKVTRANFCNNCSYYMVNYIIDILSKKYDVIISNNNPDIVFYTNQFVNTNQIDEFTGDYAKTYFDFPNASKIYLHSEHNPYIDQQLNQGEKFYTMGMAGGFKHERHLAIPFFSVTSAWQLYSECELFSSAFNWMVESKDYDSIISKKNHFACVLQSSTNNYRRTIFDKLSEYKQVRACGQFATNTEDCFKANRGVTEKETYRNKIKFQSEHYFSLQIQSTNAPFFTQEKIIQGFASNTIPIFWGNEAILADGFNPDSFINCHNFNTIDDVVEYVKIIDSDKNKMKKMLIEPIFIDNKLPYYFENNYILEFMDKIIN